MQNPDASRWLDRADTCHAALEEMVGQASFAGADQARGGVLTAVINDSCDFVGGVLLLSRSDLWGPARALQRGVRERVGWAWAIHADDKFAAEAIRESEKWAAGGSPPRGGFRRAEDIWLAHCEAIGQLQPDGRRAKVMLDLYHFQASSDHPTVFSAEQATNAALDPESPVAAFFAYEVAVWTGMTAWAIAQIALERGNRDALGLLELAASLLEQIRDAAQTENGA